MLDSLLLIVIVAASFMAGYRTRSLVSHRRRTRYLKWEPYVRAMPSSHPPQYLLQSGNHDSRR
jgi:hypothetical protein